MGVYAFTYTHAHTIHCIAQGTFWTCICNYMCKTKTALKDVKNWVAGGGWRGR